MIKKLKYLKYVAYMTGLKLKGIKYNYLLKNKGEDVAMDYVKATAEAWSKFTIDIIGIDIELSGTENIPDGPCVFIGNHSSILDVPLILHTTDKHMAFIAKKELERAPIVGQWIKRSGSIFIDRDNPREAIKAIGDGVKNIKKGYSITIFPEGTRNKNGKIGEFKKGSVKLATKSKVPIVPVSIDRASRAYEDNKDFTETKIKVVYGEPIYTENLSKEEEQGLTERIRDIVIKNIDGESEILKEELQLN
ncbi:MAG: lysophospholipid acyltransferase family protein [Sarcina sp.]